MLTAVVSVLQIWLGSGHQSHIHVVLLQLSAHFCTQLDITHAHCPDVMPWRHQTRFMTAFSQSHYKMPETHHMTAITLLQLSASVLVNNIADAEGRLWQTRWGLPKRSAA